MTIERHGPWQRVVIGLLAMGASVGSGGISAAAQSQVAPTRESVQACLAAIPRQAGTHTIVTVAEAEHCAPGSPVYQWDHPQASPSPMFIVVKDKSATVNFNDSTTRTTAAQSSTITANSCWNSWSWRNAGWWFPDSWGGISGWGYGNHCGWADTGVPTPNVGCACTGNSYQYGHYNSNYGYWNFHDNRAADWINAQYSTGPIHWNAYARIWWDTNGNTSVWAYSE